MIPQISVIMGPCAGGAVYSPAITDFTFMVKETSHMFITGPDVIKTVTGEDVTMEELGGAMTHHTKSGVAWFVGEDDEDVLMRVRYLLCFLPSNNLEDPPAYATTDDPERRSDALTHLIPDQAKEPYDMHEVIRYVVDDGEFLEVFPLWALNIVTGFARLDGRSVARDREPAEGAGRHARHRRVGEGVAVRAVLRRVQHPDPHVRRRAGVPARGRSRSTTASSATARSCCTRSPRRPCRG